MCVNMTLSSEGGGHLKSGGFLQVKILDFDLLRCINFEAEINYPEDEGIVQVSVS